MKRKVKAAKFIICLILVFGMSVQAAFGATVTITNLTSPTHPPGTWVSSPDPQFTWESSINPAPTLLGSLNTPGWEWDVVVSGTTAYVATDGGLRIVDVSNPAAPALLGSLDLPGHAWRLFVAGTTAYVAADTHGLHIIDVSNPAVPVLLGSYDTPGHASGVIVSGTTAYVGDHGSGLQIIDVSDPAAPTLLGTYDTPGHAIDVAISGTTAYVADYHGGLQIIDVSNPAAPAWLATVTGGFPERIIVSGTTAYVADGRLSIIDVSNPAAPTRLGSVSVKGGALNLAVSGANAYVTSFEDYFHIIDISNPRAPGLLDTFHIGGNPKAVAISGTTAYVANPVSGLQIIDVSNWTPTLRGSFTFDTPYRVDGVVVSGTTAYVVDAWSGLKIIDISSPSTPTLLGSYATAPWASGKVDIALSGTTAYLTTRGGGLQIIDVSNPRAPVLLGSFATPGRRDQGVAVSGTTAYVSDGPAGLQIIDVSNPAAPVLLGSLDTPGWATALAVSGTIAYVADGRYGLQIIDVSNPAAPVLLGSLDTPDWVYGVAISGTTAYVADGRSGLQIIDVSNPAAPRLLGSYNTPGEAWNVVVSGTTAYVADSQGGLHAIAVSNPAAPGLRWTFPGCAHAVAVSGTTFYVGGQDFRILSTAPGYSWQVSDSAATRPDAVRDGWNPAASFSGLPDGIHYYCVHGVFGQTVYQTQSYQFKIDNTPPVTTPSGAVNSVNAATISLTATDNASGVVSTRFILDGGAVATYTAPIHVSTPGTRTLQFSSVDVAGNREATKTVTFTITPRTFTQVAGPTRYDTAVAASRRAFPAGAGTVVIASGENWPDALGGTALAGAVDAPLLLVRPGALPPEVAAEIRRLGASKAYILGGTGAISAEVSTAVEAIVGTGNVKRLAGPTRFETSSKIASETIRVLGPAYDGTAFVATGGNFPDSLSAAPIAAAKGWPIFLARPASIDTTAMAGLGVTDVVILGGTGAVAASLETSLEARFGAANVDRIWGADRFATSAGLATFGVASAGLSWNGVGLTLGTNFPDGLAGGAMLGRSNTVMMLVAPTHLPTPVGDALFANRNVIASVVYLGGTGAIPQTVRDQVAARLR